MYKLNWNMKNLPLLVEGLHMGAYIYIFDMKGEHMDSKDKNENSHFPDDLSLYLFFGAALSLPGHFIVFVTFILGLHQEATCLSVLEVLQRESLFQGTWRLQKSCRGNMGIAIHSMSFSENYECTCYQ